MGNLRRPRRGPDRRRMRLVLPARMCRNERRSGAEKPRRKACLTGRRASGPGLGGTPTRAPEYRFRYSDALLARVVGNFRTCWQQAQKLPKMRAHRKNILTIRLRHGILLPNQINPAAAALMQQVERGETPHESVTVMPPFGRG